MRGSTLLQVEVEALSSNADENMTQFVDGGNHIR
jgi:hypothetical protein